MSSLLRLCLLLGAGAQLASSALQDSPALVQREVQVHSLAEQHKQASRLSPQILRTVLGTALSQLHSQLEAHEVTLKEDLNVSRRVLLYVRKVQSALGRRGTLFGDLVGLFPKGQFDEADKGVAMALLGLLHDKQFSNALVTGLKGLRESVMQYRWRTEKRVKELVVASASASDTKLPALIKDFFGNQLHMVQGFLKTAEKGMRTCLAALPANNTNYTVVVGMASSLVDKLMNHSYSLLSNNTEAVISSKGSQFCSGLDLTLAEDYLPVFNQTIGALSGMDSFAKANMPELHAEVAKVTKVVAAITADLTQTHELAGSWMERVCGLVGAASTS
uniref:Uncharacterized protein n=1 Tax=Alexandrium catenella TaxID=2925 RepID=A0A7S1WP06_ALECA|mmetsp:Transcript_78122/g.207328  ORF Transcript_78122/g.207328 Transcript_78122/m.207328 type:complete len:333 (+) Transcript_78122:125-1123(+)